MSRATRRYVITGGLGVGKTSLLAALSSEFTTLAEPARELIAEHRAATGEPTLDERPQTFVSRLIDRSIAKYHSVPDSAVAIFDRGLPDCLAYAVVSGVDSRRALEISGRLRYDAPVFVAPPWKEIYANDEMRRATFEQAETFYEEIVSAYDRLDYELIELPRAPIEARVEVIRPHLV